jgi:hypothetical protein
MALRADLGGGGALIVISTVFFPYLGTTEFLA